MVWEGGGYSGTPELSDMTQMQCATVLEAEGRRVQSERGKEGEEKGGWVCERSLALGSVSTLF